MAFRMTKFFSGAYGGCDLGRLFPQRFRGKEVAELGPRTSNLGPRMVLLRGMEGSPEEFAAFMQSHPLLPYYVHRMFWVDMEAPAVPRAGLAAAIAERWREGGWGGGARVRGARLRGRCFGATPVRGWRGAVGGWALPARHSLGGLALPPPGGRREAVIGPFQGPVEDRRGPPAPRGAPRG